MKKQTRKEKLADRAVRCAEQQLSPTHERFAATVGYVKGYKDAMRDVRKLVKQCKEESAGITDPVLRLERQAFCIRVKLAKFLRPIR